MARRAHNNAAMLLAVAAAAALAALQGGARADGADGADQAEWQDWQSDVTDSMGIGPSLTGYRRVGLRCGADYMAVEVETDEDFDGVLYARGAFHSREEPCFLDAHGGRNFTLRLPFDKCNTKDDNNVYSNTIVVQYDDELIMPGDAAFKLECDFKKSKDYTVSANLDSNRKPLFSRIILEDADPAVKDKSEDHIMASSDSSSVTFTPDIHRLHRRDEL